MVDRRAEVARLAAISWPRGPGSIRHAGEEFCRRVSGWIGARAAKHRRAASLVRPVGNSRSGSVGGLEVLTAMQRPRSHLLFLMLLACGPACGGAGDRVDQAVTVARELRARPADAEKVLSEHNLSAEQWEALMFEIADDPALAARYEAALQK